MENIILSFLSAYFLLVHGSASVAPCSQTPYPEVCNHYITSDLLQTLEYQTELKTSTFRDVALKVTVDQAVRAHQLVSAMDLSSFHERAKLAWDDCLELYEDTIFQLNRSRSSNNYIDAQIWLSATIANKQTCQNGFTDSNSSSYLHSFPYLLSNFSKLLSNSLAINKLASTSLSSSSSSSSSHMMFSKQASGHRRLQTDEFPTWVSGADRKLVHSTGAATKADIVVAKDGSGSYKTISEAVAASSNLRSGSKRFIIYVKAGVYKENVEIKKSMKNLMFIGDGIDATIVRGSKNAKDGSTTFRSATFAVSGDRFIARDMSFENTAGPQKYQAVALRSGSDFSVFYGCSFKGYQDTLYLYSQRQFYRNCDVYGTIDFIFGDAVAVLQNCNIFVRKPMSNQMNTITAQARSDPNENTGIIIHNSRVTAASDLRPVQNSFKTYLGRPWKKYSRTVFMKTDLDGLISRLGWVEWSGNFALKTLYYGEYMNTGTGANTGGRVKWPGYRVITSSTEAEKFTVGNFLAGSSWIPATGVPFSSGL